MQFTIFIQMQTKLIPCDLLAETLPPPIPKLEQGIETNVYWCTMQNIDSLLSIKLNLQTMSNYTNLLPLRVQCSSKLYDMY
jgi:hypothetical protein